MINKRNFKNSTIDGVIHKELNSFQDHRGWLVELWRSDENERYIHPVMVYASQTKPNVVRGPHEHKFQTDYFAFLGPGTFKIYLWDNRKESHTYNHYMTLEYGETKQGIVIIPTGVVHAYRNISSTSGLVINCPNSLYAGYGKKEAVDEVRWEDKESPFHIEDL